MLKKLVSFIVLGCTFSFSYISAQELNMEQLSSINIDNLSNDQIRSFWEKAQSQGYTLSDLENLAKLKGVPQIQISKLNQRILMLPSKQKVVSKTTVVEKQEGIDTFGITDNKNIDIK